MSDIEINDELLINIIQQNGFIYVKNHRSYKNMIKKELFWSDLATQLQLTGEYSIYVI